MKFLFVFEQGVLTDPVKASLTAIASNDIEESLVELDGGRHKLTVVTTQTLSALEALNLGQSFVKRCGV